MNHNDVVDGDKERSDLFVITEAIMRVLFRARKNVMEPDSELSDNDEWCQGLDDNFLVLLRRKQRQPPTELS